MYKFSWLFKKSLLLCLATTSTLAIAQQVDPTKPFNVSSVMGVSTVADKSSDPQQPKLQSILLLNNKKNAVINGQLLTLGDKFGQYTLNAIDAKSISLKSNDKSMTLSLFTDVLKTPK